MLTGMKQRVMVKQMSECSTYHFQHSQQMSLVLSACRKIKDVNDIKDVNEILDPCVLYLMTSFFVEAMIIEQLKENLAFQKMWEIYCNNS